MSLRASRIRRAGAFSARPKMESWSLFHLRIFLVRENEIDLRVRRRTLGDRRRRVCELMHEMDAP